MSFLSRIPHVAALLFAVAAAPVLAQQGPPPVTVAKPVVKSVVEDDEFVGRFEAAAEVDIRARVSGYLEGVHFRDGQLVEKGDLLFTIERRPFETDLDQTQAQIDVAQASFDFAAEQLDRANALVASGNIPQSVVDERREGFLGAQGELARAKASLESAAINLEYTEIHAPIAGRIDRARVDAGNLVNANETVLTSIVATDPMHFYFDIDERYFLAYARDARTRGAALQEGAGGLEVQVSLSDARMPVQQGQLDFSENRIDPETGSMRVRALLSNPDGILTPGLFGTVNVPGSLPYEAVLIPDEAVVADQNRSLVMGVQPDGTVYPIAVRAGPRIDGYRVIREGLDGSETIVIAGLMRARPGGKVTPELVELPPVAQAAGR